jgi:hypothetical protein
MTISDDTIKKAVQRYHREYDRYLKLSARVADICRTEVVEGNAIRAQVTSAPRAQEPREQAATIRCRRGRSPFLTSTQSSTQNPRPGGRSNCDLRAAPRGPGCSACLQAIRGGIGRRSYRPQRQERDNPENFYRASHVEVFLPPSDIVGTYTNVVGVPCEIQVCSMMAHVWNEIEHDLGYKPHWCSVRPGETSLIMLGKSVRG